MLFVAVPADALGEVGGEDLHDLLNHGYGDEENGGGGQPFEGACPSVLRR